jgi:hypothetical protein
MNGRGMSITIRCPGEEIVLAVCGRFATRRGLNKTTDPNRHGAEAIMCGFGELQPFIFFVKENGTLRGRPD